MGDAVLRSAGADDRNRQARGDRRRQQILEAAVELFAAKGYRGTGVAALADRVGMTATGLLYYFGTKERLLLEVVAERSRDDPDLSELDLELAALRRIGGYNAERADLTRLFIVLAAESLEPDAPLHEYFVDRYELTRAFYARLVESGQEDGTFRLDVDPDQIAREILGVVIGLEMQWVLDPERIDYPAAVEGYIDRLVRDLRVER